MYPAKSPPVIYLIKTVERDHQASSRLSRKEERVIKPFTTIAVIVFSLIASLHLLRLFFGWEVIISGRILPVWISAPGVLIASGLALMLWRESRE